MEVTKEKRKEYRERYKKKKLELLLEKGIVPQGRSVHCKKVVVFDGDEIVEECDSVRSFRERYCPKRSKYFVSVRLRQPFDGWLPNGLTARYKGQEKVESKELFQSTSENTKRKTLKQELEIRLKNTEIELEEVEDKYRKSEICSENKRELFERMCWLQTRYYSTKSRLCELGNKRDYI